MGLAAPSLPTGDPLIDFFKRVEIPEAGNLAEFHADLDADGFDEVFLSWPDAENNRAGADWTAYLFQNGAYQATDPITLRSDLLFVGQVAGHAETLLLSYHPSNVNEGTLHGVELLKDGLNTVNLGTIQPGADDEPAFRELFFSGHTPAVRFRSRAELATQYPAFFSASGTPVEIAREANVVAPASLSESPIPMKAAEAAIAGSNTTEEKPGSPASVKSKGPFPSHPFTSRLVQIVAAIVAIALVFVLGAKAVHPIRRGVKRFPPG